ncbi:unknown [Candidatus Colimorpha enterica]|uniref:Uncharacterized protein n=1 Tax=Candidatus Colimorpha enterica TaxID=3083063 RepID=R6U2H6_9BACT|nr:unknown [Candidatus Colimorpha enterica]
MTGTYPHGSAVRGIKRLSHDLRKPAPRPDLKPLHAEDYVFVAQPDRGKLPAQPAKPLRVYRYDNRLGIKRRADVGCERHVFAEGQKPVRACFKEAPEIFRGFPSVKRHIVPERVKIVRNERSPSAAPDYSDLQMPVPFGYLAERYPSIFSAASLPAPIARITVAAPVTASPPA